ncbi:MAG TPA: hypothetical protein VNG93_04310 [Candidatus Dormibacteraeota bacterium]|nr:hypothetical protein [Candidatus Dormibacteraeota bacterium]
MTDQLTGTTPRLPWVREQLRIALDILDNPGGGLVFGYQALGQARAHLAETEPERWEGAIDDLEGAERQALWRNYGRAHDLIQQALSKLPES